MTTHDAGRLDVGLYFDVEDILSPPHMGNDDSIKDLADILTAKDLRGNFLVIGDRAEQLRERGRVDVIDSLVPHDVGLHTRSARHPTNPEYVAGKPWDEAVERTVAEERQGVATIEDVFDKPCAALSVHNVFSSPHLLRAAARLGLPHVYGHPAAPPAYGLSWYAGALNIPFAIPQSWAPKTLTYFGFDDGDYHDEKAFDARLAELDRHIDRCISDQQPYLTLFLFHPQRLRLAEFIDTFWSPNGVNYPPEHRHELGTPRQWPAAAVRRALRNFASLAGRIRADRRLNVVTLTEIAKRYGAEPAQIRRSQLFSIAREITAQSSILLHGTFSPAEVVMAMARAALSIGRYGDAPMTLPREDVLGPTRTPIWVPEYRSCPASKLRQLAGELVEHVEQTGHLPATLGLPYERVGVNHLYCALATYLVTAADGKPAARIPLTRVRPWPELGTPIALAFLRAVEGALMDPDTDVNTLYRDGKLQTWTLKAAAT